MKKPLPTLEDTVPEPTWKKPCAVCGADVERYRGEGDVSCCVCGAQYNAGGQRLRDDWAGNPSAWSIEIEDLEGYELQMLALGQDF